ncbi:MAG: F0F1 ATP synthase subunit A [Thermoanaerobaculum sp.]|nr:F0F1 ATP synthase subunit A [Thermoanaerobaculum sp.]MDW7967341.1 F0F1 ATP synthase subunit A [Thermoanaerobaculum sp.]
MEHEHSIFYGPVNGFLRFLLGQPPEGWQRAMGLDEGAWLPDHVVMALFAVLVITAVSSWVKSRLSLERPSSLQQAMEVLLGGLKHLADDVIGHHLGRAYVPYMAALAFFIFTCNISGLFFFLQPPTANLNTTFALALTTFIFYNAVGIYHNGLLGHLKHFIGPVWWLAPLMLPVEIISHVARILSLSVRLFGNMFGEHSVVGVFTALVPFAIPWPLMGLGVLGSTVQTFIFVMLTAVYIAGVTAEEH